MAGTRVAAHPRGHPRALMLWIDMAAYRQASKIMIHLPSILFFIRL